METVKKDDNYGGTARWRRSAELLRPRRRRTVAAAADGDGGKEGHSTSKSGDTTPETQPSMDRGLAMIVTEVPLDGEGRRSFRRRSTAAADGDGEKEGRSTSKSRDTKPETQPSMDRGLAMIVTEVPLDGGGRRSFRRRRRRRTAAAGWMETVK
jgi:hypothetical protein